ncbi:hypothetical protein ACVNPX_02090 [Staphylococcus aureus]
MTVSDALPNGGIKAKSSISMAVQCDVYDEYLNMVKLLQNNK